MLTLGTAEGGTVEIVGLGDKFAKLTPPASWGGDNTNISADDLPGFQKMSIDEAKTLENGKLQDVPAGAKVTIEAKKGFKFKTIEAMKKTNLKTLEIPGDNVPAATIYYIKGETWNQAIENHPTENAGWSVNTVVMNGENTLFIGVSSVSPTDSIDSSKTYILMAD